MTSLAQTSKYHRRALNAVLSLTAVTVSLAIVYFILGGFRDNIHEEDMILFEKFWYFGGAFSLLLIFFDHDKSKHLSYYVRLLFLSFLICSLFIPLNKVIDMSHYVSGASPNGFLSIFVFTIFMIYVHVSIFIFFRIGCYIVNQNENFAQNVSSIDTGFSGNFPMNRISEISELKFRSKKFEYFGIIILVFIVLFISLSVLLILFAGKIVSNDTSSTNFIQVLQLRIRDLETSRRITDDLISAMSQSNSVAELAKLSANIDAATDPGIVQELNLEKNRLSRLVDFERKKLESTQSRSKDISAELASASATLNNFISKNIPGAESLNDSLQILLVSAMTRIGILVMTIYLVRFFVQIYTYNAQLNAFYLSRHDALLLSDHDSKKLSELGNFFLAPIELKSPNFTKSDPMLKGVGGLLESVKEIIPKVGPLKS
jgi:hypothetical protein